jgi:FkbH-like protein
MVLAQSDVAEWSVNWNRKADSISRLLAHLEIAPDACVVFDNDPVECEDVRTRHPDMLVVDVPSDSSEILALVQRCQWLVALPVTKEDAKRADWYSARPLRAPVFAAAIDLETFLESIDFCVHVRRAELDDLVRVAQLFERTNQFNATKLLVSSSELARLMNDAGNEIWVSDAKDRFGDYGLVASAIVQKSGPRPTIASFAMSCRAIGRHVEDTLLTHIARACLDAGYGSIDLSVRRTGRNGRFLEFISRLTSATVGATADRVSIDTRSLVSAAQQRVFGISLGEYPADRTCPAAPAGLHRANGNGLDVRELARLLDPRETPEDRSAAARSVSPCDTRKHVIETIWFQVVGRTDLDGDFYETGGDSLTALDMIYQINHVLQIEIPLTILFDSELSLRKLIQTADDVSSDEPFQNEST